MALKEHIHELVGQTPMVKLHKVIPGSGRVAVKLESFNPMSSVKDRIGLAMIRDAEERGVLSPGAPIIEATSGNTGVALAFIGAATGHPVIITMPDTMSMERRRLLKAFNARLELTPGSEGMAGAVRRAEELLEELPGAYMTRQFENPANPRIHRDTTAEEIWQDLDGNIDVFVAGVGTGGTISGTGGRLKELNPGLEVVAVEPEASPVLSGGSAGPHKIQGIGAGFVPEVLDTGLIDRIITVSSADAGTMSRRLAAEEGILAGISAGANVFAAARLAAMDEYREKQIVTIICDSGERYLSTWLFDGE
jgi:cysteine synthase A